MLQHREQGESGFQSVFVRKSLYEESLRLDGRGPRDFRPVDISLTRSALGSCAEVCLGERQRCACVVRGEIVAPYADRPAEGILQFNAQLSPGCERAGYSSHEVVRQLERCLRESDAIDLESLCIVSGELVWLVTCDVRVLDFDGNISDSCVLATLAALRAFRKPEVTVDMSSSDAGVGVGEGSALVLPRVQVHSPDEREPLPLALHDTPLAVTFGILKFDRVAKDMSGTAAKDKDKDKQREMRDSGDTLLVADCCAEEESALDGTLSVSINAHNELCSLSKPGQVAIAAALILPAVALATQRAKDLHKAVESALMDLAKREDAQRARRLLLLQRLQFDARVQTQTEQAGAQRAKADSIATPKGREGKGNMGITRDDPLLSWSLLHRPAVLREEE
jgi:exosome complex component RRP45